MRRFKKVTTNVLVTALVAAAVTGCETQGTSASRDPASPAPGTRAADRREAASAVERARQLQQEQCNADTGETPRRAQDQSLRELLNEETAPSSSQRLAHPELTPT